VKLGGAAITHKDKLETVNRESLEELAGVVSRVTNGSAGDRPKSIVLIHGAGSFGHFQAKQYGVSKGWYTERGAASERDPHVCTGFALTRASVAKLNAFVCEALLAKGVRACGVSPFSMGWEMNAKQVASDGDSARVIRGLLETGFVPVVHGDCVYDYAQGCAILSGDDLMLRLASLLRPKYCVFCTDVAGVFDRPPHEAGAQLIREIVVGNGGEREQMSARASAGMAHDVTGGMAAKLKACERIAQHHHIPVCIVEANTGHAEDAISGKVWGMSVSHRVQWTGTVVTARSDPE